jgi:hypothetical protein
MRCDALCLQLLKNEKKEPKTKLSLKISNNKVPHVPLHHHFKKNPGAALIGPIAPDLVPQCQELGWDHPSPSKKLGPGLTQNRCFPTTSVASNHKLVLYVVGLEEESSYTSTSTNNGPLPVGSYTILQATQKQVSIVFLCFIRVVTVHKISSLFLLGCSDR